MIGDLIALAVAYLFMGWLVSFPGAVLALTVLAGVRLSGRGPWAVRR